MNALEKRFGLKDRVALVTGAGQGLGRAMALTEAGAAVAVQDLSLASAERVAGEIRAAGSRALALDGDMAEESAIQRVVDRTVAELGGLDIAVNNAGIYPFEEFLKMSAAQWDRVLNLNLRGAFLATQIAGRAMAAGGRGGRIVQIASVQGYRPSGGGIAHYDVSKAGLIMLAKAAALELAPHGIAVNAVAPGLIVTPGTQAVLDDNAMGDPKVRVPLGGRWGLPEDVADAVLFLVSPAARYITGETIIIDGGFLLQ
jgi:2-dehydro-3-deoxy-D-gluconate 5-dehydrogenase